MKTKQATALIATLGVVLVGLADKKAAAPPVQGRSPWDSTGRESQEEFEDRNNAWQPPEKVMDAIGVKPGMVIGEVGAGQGRFTVRLAHRVGPTGKVYANDIDEKALAYLNERCEKDGIQNLVTVVGKVSDPLFPASQLDIAFMVNTYHHLRRPILLMMKIARALKPDGVLAIVEHDPDRMGPGWDPRESTSPTVVIDQARRAGYELTGLRTFLKRDIIYLFRHLKRNVHGARPAVGDLAHRAGGPSTTRSGARKFEHSASRADVSWSSRKVGGAQGSMSPPLLRFPRVLLD